jgi:hypothetical protein
MPRTPDAGKAEYFPLCLVEPEDPGEADIGLDSAFVPGARAQRGARQRAVDRPVVSLAGE